MLTSLLLKKVEFYNIGDFAGRRPPNWRAFFPARFFTRLKTAHMWVHAHTLKNNTILQHGKQAGTRTRLTDFLGWQTGGYTGYTSARPRMAWGRTGHCAHGKQAGTRGGRVGPWPDRSR